MPVIDPKKRPNRERYLRILQGMSPEQKLLKVFELGGLGRAVFLDGLRAGHPCMDEARLRALCRERLDRCHNRNY